MNDDEQRIADARTAASQACAALADYTRLLLRCAMVAKGRELVLQAEAALQAGGVPILRVGCLSQGAEITLQIEGQPGPALELISASGTTPDRPQQKASDLQ